MTETRYGFVFVGDDSVTVTATAEQLRGWARRPGCSWPCSQLARLDDGEELVAAFDANGLYDLQRVEPDEEPILHRHDCKPEHLSEPDEEGLRDCNNCGMWVSSDHARVDVPGDELNAWSSDVLRDVLPADHPAYFVTVGQFTETA